MGTRCLVGLFLWQWRIISQTGSLHIFFILGNCKNAGNLKHPMQFLFSMLFALKLLLFPSFLISFECFRKTFSIKITLILHRFRDLPHWCFEEMCLPWITIRKSKSNVAKVLICRARIQRPGVPFRIHGFSLSLFVKVRAVRFFLTHLWHQMYATSYSIPGIHKHYCVLLLSRSGFAARAFASIAAPVVLRRLSQNFRPGTSPLSALWKTSWIPSRNNENILESQSMLAYA